MLGRLSFFCCCVLAAFGLPVGEARAQVAGTPQGGAAVPVQAPAHRYAYAGAYSEERPVLDTVHATMQPGGISGTVDDAMPLPSWASSWAMPAQAGAPATRAEPEAIPAQGPAVPVAAPSPTSSPALSSPLPPAAVPVAAVNRAVDSAAGGLPADRSIASYNMMELAGVAPTPALSTDGLPQTYKGSLTVRASKPKNTEPNNPDAPVDLAADNLVRDERGNTVTATGHVELKQSGRSLNADQVVYNTATDTVVATGHVIFTDETGDVHFADRVQLTNQMKDGTVAGLKTYLARGGRFTSEDGTRENATLTTMHHATYTTCECAEDSQGNPPWQIRSKTMVYNEPEHRIAYHDATVDVLGLPVMWTPYFSSPDGQIKQQSGFLTPTVGYNSRLGANALERYYWGISPNQDATVGVMAMTNKNPLVTGEYRQRFDNAQIKLDGSFTDSSFADQVGGETVHKSDTLRSHMFGDGLWDINNEWRSGFHVQVASDDEYLRQYRISNRDDPENSLSGRDVLENELYAERFSGRDYTVIRAMAFQDLRPEADKTEQPSVLPEISANFIGEPNEMLGGRWDAHLSSVGLTRDGNGQDLDRITLGTGWQRRMVTGFGLVTTADAHVRGDLYRIGDGTSPITGAVSDGTQYTSRLFPDAHIVSSYPFAKAMERAQIVVSPEVSFTAAPNLDSDNDKIPNEDSQDVQLDATNLFKADRFPGYDRVEGGSHVAYGVRTGAYGYEGSSGEIFLGQSYSLNGNTIFPTGSGLSNQTSDIVGEISGNYSDRFGLDYRFDLTSDTLASERHEFDGYANWNRFQINMQYLYAKALENTNIVEGRQQLDSNVAFRLTDEWKLRTGAIYNLGGEHGFRRAVVSADYLGCCLALSLTASRNFTTDVSETNGVDFTVRIGLKGLGGYPTPGQAQAADQSSRL